MLTNTSNLKEANNTLSKIFRLGTSFIKSNFEKYFNIKLNKRFNALSSFNELVPKRKSSYFIISAKFINMVYFQI